MNETERRKYPRSKLGIELVFRLEGGEFPAKTFDLGQGGIGVLSEKEIKPGTELEIIFKKKNNYTIRGQVLWSTRVTDSSPGLYRIGIETGRIDPDLIRKSSV
jgi:hypothetical protein